MPDQTLPPGTPPDRSAFRRQVLRVVASIPRGRVLSYGDVATLCGTPRAARAVGTVLRGLLGADDEVPWHRVINAAGGISGSNDVHRTWMQRTLLEQEGIRFDPTGRVDLTIHRCPFELLPAFGAIVREAPDVSELGATDARARGRTRGRHRQ